MGDFSSVLESEDYFANPNNSYSLHSIYLLHKFSPKNTPIERSLGVKEEWSMQGHLSLYYAKVLIDQ